MDTQTKTAVALVVKMLHELPEARQVTKFVSPTLVVRATRPVYTVGGKKKVNKGEMQFVMHIGKPNFKEREYVKLLKKAGEPFPVKKVRVKYVAKA